MICIDFPIPGYRSTGGYPINSGLELPADPKTAPIYHGAVALLRAVSYLQSRPEVDAERIGMAGSSWGGFYTTLMTGLDPRLKAGSSMFGCGGLDLGNAWWDGQGRDAKRDAAFRQRWRATLDPAPRLRASKTPMAWCTGTNDSFYWMPGLMESYRGAAGPKHLSLLPNWNHALTPVLDEQVFAWLDIHLKGAPPFLTVDELTIEKGIARWRFHGPRQAKSAELIVSFGETGNWVSRHWLRVPATIAGDTCTAKVPAAPVACFVAGNVHDGRGFLTSTPLRRLDADANVRALPDYDGCSMWGGFEPAQIEFLKLHGLPVPALSADAKQGTSAARVQGKPASFGPIHYTAGFKHALRAWLKADRPGDVTIALAGTFDGKPKKAEAKVAATTAWQEVRIELTPPATLTGQLQAVVTVPPNLTATLDEVSFRPTN